MTYKGVIPPRLELKGHDRLRRSRHSSRLAVTRLADPEGPVNDENDLLCLHATGPFMEFPRLDPSLLMLSCRVLIRKKDKLTNYLNASEWLL